MGELTIRRNRGFAVPRYQGMGKAEKSAGSSGSQKVERTTVTVSETLKQLLTRVSQAEGHIRESRRTLQAGEGVLAEVRDTLERIGELAKESAGGGAADRAALQAELEQLREEIDRMIGGASVGDTPLFLDGEMGGEDGLKTLLYAVLGDASPSAEEIPDWLIQSITQKAPTVEELLSQLGLDKTASSSEILAAVMSRPLESDSAAGYLAAVYLGAVIASGAPPKQIDPLEALEGLRLLLEKVSQGVPLDQAVEQLTDGEFTSMEDFQAQFTGGTAPGLENFLEGLLLSELEVMLPEGFSGLALLAGLEGMKLELLMGLLTAAQNSGGGESLEAAEVIPEQAEAAQTAETVQRAAAGQEPAPQRASALELGTVRVMGYDLSQVSYNPTANELTVGGTQDVVLQGTGQGEPAVLVTSSGKVTLLNANLSALTVSAPMARIFSAGTSILGTVRLGEGGTLTLDGGGLLKIGVIYAGRSSTLHLAGGAVAVDTATAEGETKPDGQFFPVLVEGAASLAAQAVRVSSPEGKALEPFDVVWKTLLPGWHAVTSMALDGHQTKLALANGDPARLWLSKGGAAHGYTIHTLIARGRDEIGRPQTRYAYLHWNQNTQTFEEISMYPNPFAVTGGEAGKDWVYEEESHTLRILSAQVTAVSGGAGMDANQEPFSGRIALADGIGGLELALNGVICRVASGRAFDLGRGNQVTLVLQGGTVNFFESGLGCAGISLGDGTSLDIGCAEDCGEPAGALTASGSGGGAGIGRDSGNSRDQASWILIRGGVITAAGNGGGAGIGAGKHGAMGNITILGGVVTSSGGSGGAGIGAALGAPAGGISIQGGSITASAACHAAAIGAGVQGECGDILISGSARIVKALGGDPGADIGACLFGGCGNVRISGGADIGSASLRTRAGIPLRLGEDTVTLPQFRLSVRALGLDQLSISTQEEAKAAEVTIEADRRWISQIQEAYSALYHRMERSVSRLRGVRNQIDPAKRVVRDTASASSLLEDMRQSIRLQPGQVAGTHSKRGKEDVQQLLR